MYDFIGIYQEMICIGVLGVVGITTLVQSKFWNKNKRNIGDMLLGIAVVIACLYTVIQDTRAIYCKNTRDKIKSKTVRNCRYTEETATSDVYRQEGDL